MSILADSEGLNEGGVLPLSSSFSRYYREKPVVPLGHKGLCGKVPQIPQELPDGYYCRQMVPEVVDYERLWRDALDSGGLDRVQRIDNYRRLGAPVTEYFLKCNPALGAKLFGCGTWLQLRHWYTEGVCRVFRANHCKEFKLCPFCASRRAYRLVQGYLGKVRGLLRENPGLTPVHCVLTWENHGDCRVAIEGITEGFKVLLENGRNFRKGLRSSSALGHLAGGVRALEVKRGERSGLWHPHWHCLLLLDVDAEGRPGWVDQEALRAEWSDIMRREAAIPYLRRLPYFDEKLGRMQTIDEALVEVFKYVVKFGALEPEDVFEVYRATRRLHFVKPWGCLNGVEVLEDLGEDGLPGELPYVDHFLRYSFGLGKYQRTGAFFHVD